MKVLRRFFLRLTGSITRREDDSRFREEIEEHLALQAAEYIKAGMSPEEARRRAILRFGTVEAIKEHYRDEQRLPFVEHVVQDVRFAIRALRVTPTFTTVAIFTLALGIGATTAIFSVTYAVLIAPYPYVKAHEIWEPRVLSLAGNSGKASYSIDELSELSRLPAFADVIATRATTMIVTGDFGPENVRVVQLSAQGFNFLGVPPALGRTLQPSDIGESGHAEPVAVLSHRLWLRLFSASPTVIGKSIRLDRRPHVIVGVMPPRFGWHGDESIWVPLDSTQRSPMVEVAVRLAGGLTPRTAEEHLQELHLRLAQESPATFPRDAFRTVLLNYVDSTVATDDMRRSLRLLFGAALLLLLIACANVANLQMVRATARTREVAVRACLGADRWRLIRQLLTESLVLAIGGGLAGVFLAVGATHGIAVLLPPSYVPNEVRIEVNIPVLFFAVQLSVLTALVFGLAPAVQGAQLNVIDALRSGAQSRVGSRQIRHVLVIGEIALSLVLLSGAMLLIRTFIVLHTTDIGIDAHRILMVGVPLRSDKYGTVDERNRYATEILQRVSVLPGVEAASIGNGGAPFGGPPSSFRIVSRPDVGTQRVLVNLVGADHLRTFGIALQRGRTFRQDEIARGTRVALVNQAAARLWGGDQSVIGARVRLGILERAPSADSTILLDHPNDAEVTIIGIFANTRNTGLRGEPTALVLLPYTIIAPTGRNLTVRANDPKVLLNPIREQMRVLDQEQPVGRAVVLSEDVALQRIQPRFLMALSSFFAAGALMLSATGLYGMLSSIVTRRRQEIGVRMALGAPRHHVLTLILTTGARVVALGVTVGMITSLATTRLLRSHIFGVPLLDPVAYLATTALLAAVAVLACYLPARRAARVDPLVALRYE